MSSLGISWFCGALASQTEHTCGRISASGCTRGAGNCVCCKRIPDNRTLLDSTPLTLPMGGDAKELEISVINGKTWKLHADSATTGEELRGNVASLARIPEEEVTILCEGALLEDKDIVFKKHPSLINAPIRQLYMYRKQKHLALSCAAESAVWDRGVLKLWDLDQGLCSQTLRGHTRAVCCLSVDWVSQVAISGSADRTLKLWDLVAGTCAQTMQSGGHEDAISCVALCWSQRLALSGSLDCTLKLWDVEGCLCYDTLQGHDKAILCVVVNWHSQQALSGSADCSLKLWDLEGTVCTKTLRGHQDPVTCVSACWSKRVAVSGSFDNTMMVWALDEGNCVSTLYGHVEAVCCVAVDWDSSRIVSGSADTTLKVWNLDRASCIETLRGHTMPVSCVSVDWCTRRIVSGSGDKTLKIWDLDRSSCVATLDDHAGEVRCVDMSLELASYDQEQLPATPRIGGGKTSQRPGRALEKKWS
eukprot:gnl/TRDRNA2_/TRDRNA2_64746_c0_seq1.p1 gnl/TRDRNA2_/TRDRNA2_64746_c0~~gnl/TRDRNA2_/TRDRNA2_64746_c0_seq1.p1  ORF type:complete len:475 (+),score=62.00 gnl/TRDRNA2_/TRDRNA2_64746_c0_seq1:81-1505(+)